MLEALWAPTMKVLVVVFVLEVQGVVVVVAEGSHSMQGLSAWRRCLLGSPGECTVLYVTFECAGRQAHPNNLMSQVPLSMFEGCLASCGKVYIYIGSIFTFLYI